MTASNVSLVAHLALSFCATEVVLHLRPRAPRRTLTVEKKLTLDLRHPNESRSLSCALLRLALRTLAETPGRRLALFIKDDDATLASV